VVVKTKKKQNNTVDSTLKGGKLMAFYFHFMPKHRQTTNLQRTRCTMISNIKRLQNVQCQRINTIKDVLPIIR